MEEIHGWEAAYRRCPSGAIEPHEDAEFLDRFFRAHGVSRILDLGCGDGRHLVYFAKRGYSLYGLDVAPTAIKLAQEWLARENLSAELVASDMTSIPWPDGFFDAVICIKVINHDRIREIRKTMREVHRTLRAGGYLFVAVGTDRPDPPPPPERAERVEPNTYVLMQGHEKGVPHHFFDMDELLHELRHFRLLESAMPIHRDSRRYTSLLAQKPAPP